MPGRRLTGFLRAAFGKRIDNRPDGGMKAFGVRAGVAGRGHVNDIRQRTGGSGPDLAEVEGDVFADGLRQAGCGDADHLRRVLADDVFQSLAKVLAAPKNRRRLGEIRAGDVHRLFEMADHVPANIRRAALRTVQEGNRPFDTAEGQARARAQSLQALRAAVFGTGALGGRALGASGAIMTASFRLTNKQEKPRKKYKKRLE